MDFNYSIPVDECRSIDHIFDPHAVSICDMLFQHITTLHRGHHRIRTNFSVMSNDFVTRRVFSDPKASFIRFITYANVNFPRGHPSCHHVILSSLN